MVFPREWVEQHRGVIPRRVRVLVRSCGVRALNARMCEQERGRHMRVGAPERGGARPRGCSAHERGGPRPRGRSALERGGPRPGGRSAVPLWRAAGATRGVVF
jgi:hypothetical protein